MEDEVIKLSGKPEEMIYKLRDVLGLKSYTEVLNECIALMYDVKIDKGSRVIKTGNMNYEDWYKIGFKDGKDHRTIKCICGKS